MMFLRKTLRFLEGRLGPHGGLGAGSLAALLLGILLSLVAVGCSTTIITPVDRYALVYGIATYRSNPLTYTVADADSMSQVLTASGWQVTERTNAAVTYAQMAADIAALASKPAFSANSTILVYYSGHGMDTTGELVPWDAVLADGSIVASSLISPAKLSGWLGSLACMNKLLILDSCFSGQFVDTGASADASSQNASVSGYGSGPVLFTALAHANTLLADSLASSGDPDVMAISASGSDESSYDAPSYGHGAFTNFFLEAATKADKAGKGYVTATEAFTYTRDQLNKLWNPTYALSGMALLPHISGGAGDFVLFVKK
jgi:uncharacterized caspase-like protein